VDQPINAAIPGGRAIQATKARLVLGDRSRRSLSPKNAREVVFRVRLRPGKMKLQTWLVAKDGASRGAYYVYVRRLS
jgi:hypothetical protein